MYEAGKRKMDNDEAESQALFDTDTGTTYVAHDERGEISVAPDGYNSTNLENATDDSVISQDDPAIPRPTMDYPVL